MVPSSAGRPLFWGVRVVVQEFSTTRDDPIQVQYRYLRRPKSYLLGWHGTLHGISPNPDLRDLARHRPQAQPGSEGTIAQLSDYRVLGRGRRGYD